MPLKICQSSASIMMDGTVIGVSRDLLTVELDNKAVVKATISGRLFKNKIRILTSDKVVVEMTPYDMTRMI